MQPLDNRPLDNVVSWPSGPPTDALAEMLRTLELTVARKLAGFLHGQYQGITPGQGSEIGESRMYQVGDDVRRIDWNVTARTRELFVRDQIADRDLEGWIVVDVSAPMQFSTVGPQKASLALGAAAAVGFLTARNQNRLGAVLVAGPELKTFPPRPGRPQVRAILHAISMPPASAGKGRADLGAALQRVGAVSRRRGFITVISDFLAPQVDPANPDGGWQRALGAMALRNDVLCIEVVDPRELDIPAVGYVALSDPATGRVREVQMTAELQRRYKEAALQQRAGIRDTIRRAGADHLLLSTDQDWVGALIQHVRRRKVQVAGVGGGLHR
ncbi:MAG: hypothetical protein JWM34_3505 [Ilumatobacteraceae bacterium]|nr:hypothetical protein [Ilumatobacteraceae bacterium]